MIEYPSVTDDIRKAVKIEMIRRDLSRDEVAQLANVTPEHVSRMLNAKSGGVPAAWRSLLDALGLELRVVPKQDR